MNYAKKLIEVALPLEAINEASAREKSIRHGHPSTLHLWWARRPLAAARAVIFAQMVDDPSARPDLFPTEKAQQKERLRLFKIIEDLVKWENTTNEGVLSCAREEIWQSWRRACAENADHPRATELFDRQKLPAFHDPFAGGGALPLEAQRLGLEAWASDLNPVAVLINKAMIEIPPKFAGQAPVNPDARKNQLIAKTWKGAAGLAEDVRHYGQWMRLEAEKRIGHLYSKIQITDEMICKRPDLAPYRDRELTVIAWLWARTVHSPNPAFAEVEVPLASTFMLSTKVGKEAYVEPVIEGKGYRFTVKMGKPKDENTAKNGTKLARGANFRCLMSNNPIESDYIYSEANAGRMGARLMAIVAEGDRGRVYLAPNGEHEAIAQKAIPTWKPDALMPENPRWFSPPLYGLKSYGDLFTPRQLTTLDTFSDLVEEAIPRIELEAIAAGLKDDHVGVDAGGTGARGYAEAVGVYLSFVVDRCVDFNSSVCGWISSVQATRNTFARQAIPMTWDFAEINFFGGYLQNFDSALEKVISPIESNFVPTSIKNLSNIAFQADAQCQMNSMDRIVSTDPPYYDNIGYADLSDFFYVWLRKSLKLIFPSLFSTLAVPKSEELVATPYRHGGKENAEKFFLDGMTLAMNRLVEQAHPGFPVSIYYAFKQTESEGDDGTASTGWETFLEALMKSGFSITGTWPMRTELGNRMIGSGTNALASSIVLVCRKRRIDAPIATRREFQARLKADLPRALLDLQRGNIAPVDLAQASIGPGMAIYTSYAQVLDSAGKPLSVRQALALINQVLDETLAEQEGDFDADSRMALAWFEQYGFDEAEFGVADVLARAKDTSVSGMVDAGILHSRQGKVRLLKPAELPIGWNPATDARLSAWEIVHQLVRALDKDGEQGAARLLGALGGAAESARELAYRLYNLCERKKRPSEALAYNGLVQSWPELLRLAKESGAMPKAGELF